MTSTIAPHIFLTPCSAAGTYTYGRILVGKYTKSDQYRRREHERREAPEICFAGRNGGAVRYSEGQELDGLK